MIHDVYVLIVRASLLAAVGHAPFAAIRSDCVCDDVSAAGASPVRCHGDRCPSIDGCHDDDNLASLCRRVAVGV